MYYSKLTLQPYQKSPPEDWIKEKLFKQIIEETDLMNKLLNGNKIALELYYTKSNENNLTYEMTLDLVCIQSKDVVFMSSTDYSQDLRNYTKPKKWNILSKTKALFFKVFKG